MKSTPRSEKLTQLSAHLRKAADHGIAVTGLRLGEIELPNATIIPYKAPNVWIVRARFPVAEVPQNWPPSHECIIMSYGLLYSTVAEEFLYTDSENHIREINFLVQLDRPFPNVCEIQ